MTAIVIPGLGPGQPLQLPLRPGDLPWQDFLQWAPPVDRAVEDIVHVADAYETTNILFSSGTTVSAAT